MKIYRSFAVTQNGYTNASETKTKTHIFGLNALDSNE